MQLIDSSMTVNKALLAAFPSIILLAIAMLLSMFSGTFYDSDLKNLVHSV
jgi:hypothetical protein